MKLTELRRVEARIGCSRAAVELAAVAGQRALLGVVVRRHIDDERRRAGVVDEVVTHPGGSNGSPSAAYRRSFALKMASRKQGGRGKVIGDGDPARRARPPTLGLVRRINSATAVRDRETIRSPDRADQDFLATMRPAP
jgi:hypothetical protein